MKCPYCKSKNTYSFFKAQMPTILSACPAEVLRNCTVESIDVALCRDCSLGFNASPLSADKLKYIYDNYLYISPSSGIGSSRYNGMLSLLKRYAEKSWKIVEIGCSEGYVLERLREYGFTNLMGIEPGPQADQAQSKGLNVTKGYFRTDSLRGDEKVDSFYMMHVFEHFADPFAIFRSMSDVLAEKGIIVLEIPDFCGFQHQHLYFYNIVFFERMARDFDFKVIDWEVSDGDLRVVLTPESNECYASASIAQRDDDIFGRAKSIEGVYSKQLRDASQFVSRARASGSPLYWWGAGSASVICINQILGYTEFPDYEVVDGFAGKWGLIMPGVNKKVKPYTILNNATVNYVVIASSFHAEIKKTMASSNITANNICSLSGF